MIDAAPNSPKKVTKLDDGTFKNEKTGEIFDGCKKEIRITFKASNGKETITCICFTKTANAILEMDSMSFTDLEDAKQKEKVTSILYETKLLTLKNQGYNFLLLNVEDVQSILKKNE